MGPICAVHHIWGDVMRFAMSARRSAAAVLAASAIVMVLAITMAPTDAASPAAIPTVSAGLATNDIGVSNLYVNPERLAVSAGTLSAQQKADAELLSSFPTATWFTGGTPEEVRAGVQEIVRAATDQGTTPVLVAYNLPFRDCAQYSAGGAANTAAYAAWIRGFAAGIGTGDAIVIVEPDGLGIIPWYTTADGVKEWCRPAQLTAATAAADRFAQLNMAVDALAALPHASVYLDGTHSDWLSVGEIADRLQKAGVDRTNGFFLNASSYVATERLQKYGSWLSDCLYLSQNGSYDPRNCASQYYPADPNDFSTWVRTDAAYDKAFSAARLTRNADEQAHFVLDTSRNGRGSWTAPAGKYPDAEPWCNPPGRGLGMAPNTETGIPLLDAYLWIKVPGESDGQCHRGTGGPADPERGMVAPPAGTWFPEQAAELIALSPSPIAFTPAPTLGGK